MTQVHIPEDGPRRVLIMGSTGSIGTQALDVIAHCNALAAQSGARCPAFEVVGLAAGSNADLLAAQAKRFGVSHVALASGDWPGLAGVTCCTGATSAEELVRSVEADVVVAAIVGFSGLPSTCAAVALGRDVALANKETLVAAGEWVVAQAHTSGARLLPVDSEHAGVWSSLVGALADSNSVPPTPVSNRVSRVILTASGGPFRTWSPDAIRTATPDQALKHPTWAMGSKVSIDSASLTNKALELIEAHWLFGLDADHLDAVIHPQSIIHAIVQTQDGSSIAHLANPDMQLPIFQALTWQLEAFKNAPGMTATLDFDQLHALTFEPIDLERFPAFQAARIVMQRGGTAGAIFNAANEIAVAAFLSHAISFGSIAELSLAALNELPAAPIGSLADVETADAHARDFATRWVAKETNR